MNEKSKTKRRSIKMNLIQIVERLRIIYEDIEHLLGSDDRYDIEDLIEEIQQEIIHGDENGEDEEG
jgi:hypothetical protein